MFQRLLIEPLEKFLEKIIQFLPNFFISIVILFIGFVAGFVLRMLFLKLFRAVNIDKISERSGAMEMMKKGGMKEPVSDLLSALIGWVTVIIFAGISLSTLQMPTVDKLLESFLLYIPNIFISSLILLVGYLLGNFLSRAALIASVNAGIQLSGLIGKFVKFTVLTLALTMALEQLGIGKETVIIAFAIIFGGIVLAFAVSFGLGGRDLAREYLEKKLKREEKRDDISYL
jgi:small-conductance mechanosensitive channel